MALKLNVASETPLPPAAGQALIYPKADGQIYVLTADGVEHTVAQTAPLTLATLAAPPAPQGNVARVYYATDGYTYIMTENGVAHRVITNDQGGVYVPLIAGHNPAIYQNITITAGSTTTINMTALAGFALPVGVRGVSLRVGGSCSVASTSNYLACSGQPTPAVSLAIVTRSVVANQYVDSTGICPVATNGNIYIFCNGSANWTAVFLICFGYFL